MKELSVVQDFVSEDYFTSDSNKESFRAKALELRKQFEEDEVSPLSAWSGTRGALQKELLSVAGLSAQDAGMDVDRPLNDDEVGAVTDFYGNLLRYLGFASGAIDAVPGMNVDGSEAPYLEVRGTATEKDAGAALVIVFAKPVADVSDLLDKDGATLLTPIVQSKDDGPTTSTTSVARFLSQQFRDENPPELALVLAGNSMLLTQAARWPEGRYLAIDLGLLLETSDTKKGGAVDRFLACASAAAIAPGPDGTTWFTSVFEDSVKHTEQVSGDLREAVRTSIEIIANDVVARRRAQGLPPLPADQAQPLAKQALRFLYRILFLLYAEASPELQVVPASTTEYEAGYGLDRLRELALVPIPSRGQGTHLYESLKVLFDQIQNGHNDLRVVRNEADVTEGREHGAPAPRASVVAPTLADDTTLNAEEETDSESLTFHPLEADLFAPVATAHIDEVKLGNDAMQQVLQRLLLSKESKKKQRGFISYAELGINQLGRVYEGLMSYTGFFAQQDLFEVAPHGDPSKGSWVVPTDRADHIDDEDFVKAPSDVNGDLQRVLHRAGTFVFRLSGRDRQQSASYYTPEVLTKFTVSQALAELLTEDTTADDILKLTVCEPALGSGAFALEGVRQLAAEYLKRKQVERNEKIPPDAYQRELQKTKAYIALHNVYGVDLNGTAVELAEISLWLDTMVAGLSAPWFGLRLRRGNSLIGARRSVFSHTIARDKSYLKSTPTRVELSTAADCRTPGEPLRDPKSVYQFLLPAEGWGAAVDAKEGKNLAPQGVKALKDWRKSVRVKLADTKTNPQLARAQALSDQVDALWSTALKRLTIAEAETRRSIPLWGQPGAEAAKVGEAVPVSAEPSGAAGAPVTRAEVERKLADENGAYRRLRRVMDAWCSLWFWPLTETEVKLPSIDEWLDACEQLLGKPLQAKGKNAKAHAAAQAAGQTAITDVSTWAELNDFEYNQLVFSQAVTDVDKVLEAHPWLRVAQGIAEQQGFFHWGLDFATVFQRGGFDLQLGNPPWVRPTFDLDALLAEGDPWWQLAQKPSEAERNRMREQTMARDGIRDLVLEGATDIEGTNAFLGSASNYRLLAGQTNLYRCFMEQTWNHESTNGIVTLIHPETHFTDDKAQLLRKSCYLKLRRHWQFINELKLYEIHDLVRYGVHVYGRELESPSFLTAASIYHPDTVERSLRHNGDGPEPGVKTPDGHWDLGAHAARILHIGHEQLESWRDTLTDPDTPVLETPMVYTVNRSSAAVLEKLSHQHRIRDLQPYFSAGWHERSDRQKGRFELRWGQPSSWNDVILQGPAFHVGNPFYKQPNPTMKHNQDWSAVDLEQLAPDAIPVTSYKPIHDGQYDKQYTHWTLPDGTTTPARDHYRAAWRNMAANHGERTLIPALIPPGAAHVDAVSSLGFVESTNQIDAITLAVATGSLSSLLVDFMIRAAPKAHIRVPAIERLPAAPVDHPLAPKLVHRVLRLNCLTEAYADLWNACVPFMRGETDAAGKPIAPVEPSISSDPLQRPASVEDGWTGGYGYPESVDISTIDAEWTPNTPLRLAADRRQAQIEIDALMAIMLGVTADELCSIYRTQFPVLYKYDTQRDHYDASGCLIEKEDIISDRQASTLNRHADLRQAMHKFEKCSA